MRRYPTLKVIAGYTVLGGYIGGLVIVAGLVLGLLLASILSIPSIIGSVLSGDVFKMSLDELKDSLVTVSGFSILTVLFAIPLGAIPAFLAGSIIASLKIHWYGMKEILWCFFIGVFTTVLVFGLWLSFHIAILWFGVIGGVSSVILAFLFLPKD